MRHGRGGRLVGLCGLALSACADAREVRETIDVPSAGGAAGQPDAAVSSNVMSPSVEAWLAQPVFAPGARLRAHVQDAGGDAVALLGLYDAELGFECTFASTEDGVQRCLPGASALTYLDPACTQPVFRSQRALASGNCVAPGASEFASMGVRVRAQASCQEASPRRVYRAGASRAPAQVYVKDSRGCAAASVSDCLYDFEAMPADAFERGAIQRRVVDHGLAVDEIRYEDGARVIARLIDQARDASCEPMPEVAGDRCLPVEQAHDFGSMYREASCTGERVAIDPSHAEPCGSAKLALSWDADLCGHWHMTLFELGPRIDVGYQSGAASCSALGSETDGAIYQIGAMLDLKSLPAVRSAQARGPRLALTYFASLGGRPLMAARGFTDTLLDRACYVESFSDGSERCVPRTLTGGEPGDVGVYGPFLDAGCETRALAWQKPRAPCAEVPDFARIWPADSSRVDHVARVGRRAASMDTIYVMNAGACVSSPSDPDSDYYQLGPPIDLPVVTARVD
jgi:hypothetical protein